VTTTQRINDSF